MLGGTLGEPFVQPAAHADPGQLCTPVTVGDRSESGAVSPAMATTSSPPPSATTSGCNEEADWRGLAALAIGLVAAPVASADPSPDYLDALSNTPGFTVNGFTGPLLLGAGNTICTDLRAGMSPQDSANNMMLFYPGATNVTIKAMVATAQQTLCLDTVR